MIRSTPHEQHGFLRTSGRRGFSLVELLVVVAIIGLLSFFAVVGFNSMALSHGVGQAAADATGVLELARNEAVTRQTYVWAAFRETTRHGALEIQMAVAGSIDGSTNAVGTNLVALSRVVTARNVGLTNFASLQPGTRALVGSGAAPSELLANTAGITFTNLPQSKTVTFTPGGEAMLAGTPGITQGFDPLIGVGIVPARGDQKDGSGRDEVGIVIDGSTGMARQLRLH